MSIDEIKKAINAISGVPAMPNVVTKALNVMKDPESGAIDLTRTVENDQAITVQLLKVVNSPYFGLSKPIQTVGQAISLLGFNEVKTIILSCAMKPMMTTQGGKDIWEHSVNTAVGAELMAKKMGLKDYDEYFTHGLMHDLGKIVFELYNPKRAAEAIQMINQGTDVIMAEKMLFGFDHTEVSYFLGGQWGLPKQIISVMRYHHKPQYSEYKNYAGITYIANKIVQSNPKHSKIEPEVTALLGLQLSNTDALRRQTLDKARMLINSFNY